MRPLSTLTEKQRWRDPFNKPVLKAFRRPTKYQANQEVAVETMESSESNGLQGTVPPAPSSIAGQLSSFPAPPGGLSPPVEAELQTQMSLAKQTPYQRMQSGYSRGDTGILLGQRDFAATLNRGALFLRTYTGLLKQNEKQRFSDRSTNCTREVSALERQHIAVSINPTALVIFLFL
ncbi:aquaporin, putative [Eimeria brunetti]|uniref:Aquaporin, putative n=1 Tax=Eimeria brunetti TaxID=51314 RepID=U6LM69_9EIME|nr:aquaporin, putative [Eimeria brunetti]